MRRCSSRSRSAATPAGTCTMLGRPREAAPSARRQNGWVRFRDISQSLQLQARPFAWKLYDGVVERNFAVRR